MSLPPLNVIIGADTSRLEAGLSRARRGITLFAGAAGAALGAVTAGLTALTVRSMGTIDAQAKLARALGGTTAAVQAMDRAANRAGVGQGEFASAAAGLNRRLGEIIVTGSGAEDTFRALGLTAQQLAGMDVDERFASIADAMRRAGMSSQQMAYHLRQLGVRQANVIQLLQQGGDDIRASRRAVEEFGVAVSEVDAAAIERANDAIADIGLVFTGIGNQLAVTIAPLLERMAVRFTDLAKEGGAVRTAIDRLVEGFGRLAEVVTSDAFIDAAVSALEGLMRFAGGAAEALVFLANNFELAAGGAAALSIAMMGLGGPFGLIAVGVGAVVALAVALNTRASPAARTMEQHLIDTEAAQRELNAALGVFSSTGAPAAAAAAVTVARRLEAEALAALSAAQAHRELQAARVAAMEAMGDGGESNPAIRQVRADLADADARVMAILGQLEEARRSAYVLMMSVTQGPAGGQGGGGGGGGEPPAPPGAIPALPGGGGAVRDELAQRLEALTQGLMTEQETVQQYYDQGLETLIAAREAGLLTEQEFMEQRERLEAEHHARLTEIRDRANQHEVQMRRRTVDMLTGLLGALGNRSKTAARLAVALNAAKAIAETIQNTAAASVRALAELGPIAGPAAAARIKAYGAAQVGIIAANAALQMGSKGGGGGGGGPGDLGGGGGGGGAGSSGGPGQTIRIDLQGDRFSGDSIRALFDQFNEGLRAGYRIDRVIVQ
jgi:uncharacterized membrane protein YgcG